MAACFAHRRQALRSPILTPYHPHQVGYNAFQSAGLSSRDEWEKVHMLHDMSAVRQQTIFGLSGYGHLWRNVTMGAWAIVQAEFGSALDKYGTMRFTLDQALRHAQAQRVIDAELFHAHGRSKRSRVEI